MWLSDVSRVCIVFVSLRRNCGTAAVCDSGRVKPNSRNNMPHSRQNGALTHITTSVLTHTAQESPSTFLSLVNPLPLSYFRTNMLSKAVIESSQQVDSNAFMNFYLLGQMPVQGQVKGQSCFRLIDCRNQARDSRDHKLPESASESMRKESCK